MVPQSLGTLQSTTDAPALADPFIHQPIPEELPNQPQIDPAPLQSLPSLTTATAPLPSAVNADGPKAQHTSSFLPIPQSLQSGETLAHLSSQPEANGGVEHSAPEAEAPEAGTTPDKRLETSDEARTLPAEPQYSLENLVGDIGEHIGLLQGTPRQEKLVAQSQGAAAEKDTALRKQVPGSALSKSYQFGQLNYVSWWWDDGPSVVPGTAHPGNSLATHRTSTRPRCPGDHRHNDGKGVSLVLFNSTEAV